MDSSEYLAFIPLLLYGIGLADILSEWKRLFDPKEWYLPYSAFTIVLTETAIYNVFIYMNLIEQFGGQSYLDYLLMLLPPFLFLLTTSAFTPDKESGTREYFIRRMPVFFSLLALFVASHFLYDFDETFYMKMTRLLVIVIIIIIGFTRKIWLIYLLVVLWAMIFVVKSDFVTTSGQRSNSADESTTPVEQDTLAVRNLVLHDFVAAYQSGGTAKNIADLFVAEAEMAELSGPWIIGQPAIEKRFSYIEELPTGRGIHLELQNMYFLDATAAWINVNACDKGGIDETGKAIPDFCDRRTFIVEKRNGEWKITALRVFPAEVKY
jgi:hypothetical protein